MTFLITSEIKEGNYDVYDILDSQAGVSEGNILEIDVSELVGESYIRINLKGESHTVKIYKVWLE